MNFGIKKEIVNVKRNRENQKMQLEDLEWKLQKTELSGVRLYYRV